MAETPAAPDEGNGDLFGPRCGECGAVMVLRPSRFGRFFGCSRWPECDGTHGAHALSGEPLGTPADKATRQARQEAHLAFDQAWRALGMSRTEAYGWLQHLMRLPEAEAHIACFNLAQCRELCAILACEPAVAIESDEHVERLLRTLATPAHNSAGTRAECDPSLTVAIGAD